MKTIELGGIILTIAENVLSNLLGHVQDTSLKAEAGGILMGYYIDDSSFLITDISTPTSKDRRSRFNFIRSHVSAQKFINRRFINSNGKKIYLGEWHTHPEDFPTPSCTDLNSFEKQIKSNVINSKIIFMLIIGINGIYVASYNKQLLDSVRITYEEMKMK